MKMTPIKALERACMITDGETIVIPRYLAESLIDYIKNPDAYLKQYLLPGRSLTAIERAVLTKLQLSPGVPVRNTKLLKCSRTASLQSLWVHINRLRDKIDPRRCEIHSVRCVGYQLEIRDHDKNHHDHEQ